MNRAYLIRALAVSTLSTLVACSGGRAVSSASVFSATPAASAPVTSSAAAAPGLPSSGSAPVVPLYQSAAFTVWPDRVEQGPYVARAESATLITSTYQSPASRSFNRRIEFKFALNGRDNELPVGVNHTLVLFPEGGRVVESPLIEFGKLLDQQTPVPSGSFLEPNTRLRLRLDLRAMRRAFRTQGYFDTFNGQRIFQQEFKGVFVAGSFEPLGWDFDNLAARPQFQLRDPDGDGLYEIELLLNPGSELTTATATTDSAAAPRPAPEVREWRQTRNISSMPRYTSGQPLVDALWNLSLEELLLDIRPDKTLMAGAKWDGVWTRDISYAIVLSLAHIRPDLAMNSLRRKVAPDGRIVQDTGTGGSWPVSSDRQTWALAAWEVYAVTGDEAWLRYAYDVITRSLAADERTVARPGELVRGESSFLDWRQQTYPRWMQPADIYESRCLGTNVVFARTYEIVAQMAARLGLKNQAHTAPAATAAALTASINESLWAEGEGYYGQFRYGRPTAAQLSPRWEALGEALAVVVGTAPPERATTIVKRAPALLWGVPTVWPGQPDVPPYHNQSVWPFVQAYWNWALARQGAGDALSHGLAALYRPAALFLTNKENLNAFDGDFKGTEINSDRQLWSVAGNLAMVTRVFFGMEFQPDKLTLAPCVPAAYAGEKVLTNFHYRGSLLTLRLRGTGNKVKFVALDGQLIPAAEIPASLTGAHQLVVQLANEPLPTGPPVRYVEPTAEAFGPEPVAVPATALVASVEPTKQVRSGPSDLHPRGFTGSGYTVLSRTENTRLDLAFKLPKGGRYAIDFRYANGAGPVNTDNKCALRTLLIDGKPVGPVVLPQRGAGEWSAWGWSNTTVLDLGAGEHIATLAFEPQDENMNAERENTALLDHMRVWRP